MNNFPFSIFSFFDENQHTSHCFRHHRRRSRSAFTGGDPFYQSEAFAELADLIKAENPRKTIWCYTGFSFEEILADEKLRILLEKVDVLVDGPFTLALRDVKNLRFRGSSNQRIIDVPASLAAGTVIEWTPKL